MAKYRRKPNPVDAVQWKGDNLDQIKRFLGPDFLDVIHHNIVEFATVGLYPHWRIPVGHWIIREDGRHRPIAPDLFAREFERHLVDPELYPLGAVGPEEVRRLYWDEGLSMTQVGDKFGVNNRSVHKFMVRHGIKRRAPGSGR